MSQPLHVKVRKKIKSFFERVLYKIFPAPKEIKINKEEIKSILLIRINYRIGNMLFITPLLSQIKRDMPDVKVDILVGAPFTKTLFSGFKNVQNVYDFPRALLKNPIKLFGHILNIRSKKYDAVININGGSTSDKLATLFAKATYKIAFCDDYSYSTANVCVRRKLPQTLHEALKPIELISAFEIVPDYYMKLDISLNNEEFKKAKKELENLIGKNDKKVFGIFRNARNDKKLEDEFWMKLIQELKKLDKDIIFVDILSPDIPKKLQDDMYEYSNKNLRILAAFMANLDAFICGDTGPMHLASASGVPTIALFKTTLPLLYGTLKESDLSLVLQDKSIQEVAKEIDMHLKNIKKEK